MEKFEQSQAVKTSDNVEAAAEPRAYRSPEVFPLGSVEQVQAYYTGSYRDGPRSSYWYNG